MMSVRTFHGKVFSSSTSSVAELGGTVLKVAPIVLVPRPKPKAVPSGLIEATEVFDELHVTALLSSTLLPSLKKAVAVNFSWPQEALPRSCGEIAALRRRALHSGGCPTEKDRALGRRNGDKVQVGPVAARRKNQCAQHSDSQ